MRAYNMLHPFILSFYSPSLYRDVARNWKGTCFLYLFLLLILAWIPGMYLVNKAMTFGVNYKLLPIVRTLPQVTIKEGVLSINKPVPYRVYDPDTKQLIGIVDTSGQYKSLDNTPAKFLVTDRQIIIKKNDTETRTLTIQKNVNAVVGPTQVEKVLLVGKFWLPIVLYPILVIFSFVYRMIQSLLYAILGLIFARISRSSLEYPALLRISVVALTPAVVLATIQPFLKIYPPYQGWIFFAITTFYIIFGIFANRDSEMSSGQ